MTGNRPQTAKHEPAAVASLFGRWRPVLECGLLALLGFGVFANALDGGFVADDHALLQSFEVQDRPWRRLLSADMLVSEGGARSGFYRPVASASLLLDRAVHGARASGFHTTNLLLHIVSTWFVYGLARRFGWAALAAAGAAALFAVHPVHVEAVSWISGRFDVLCGMFYLAALWFFAGAHQGRSPWRYVAALVLGTLALGSKEMAVSLPLGIVLADTLGLSRRRGPRRVAVSGFWGDGWRGVFLRALPFVVLVAAYFALRSALFGSIAGRAGDEVVPVSERLFTSGSALLYYLERLAWPARLDFYPILEPVTHVASPLFLGGAVLFAALIALAVRCRRAWPQLAFGIGFLLVAMLPLSHAAGLYAFEFARYPVAERYLYLPSAGFVLALGALLLELSRRIGDRRQVAAGAAFAALAVLGTLQTVGRNRVWADDRTLIERTVQDDPENAWVHAMHGLQLRRDGDPSAARTAFTTALRLQPRLFTAVLEMARLDLHQGDLGAAQTGFERALALRPLSRDARLGLASALRRQGNLDGAEEQFALLLSGGARDAEVLVNQGDLFLARGRIEAAESNFEAALALDPRRKEAIYDLGIVHQRRGEFAEAEESALASLAIDPAYAAPYVLLGNLAVQKRDFATAVRHYTTAAQLDPSDVMARVNLGASYLNLGDYAKAGAVLQKAIEMRPTSQAYVNLGEAQNRGGDAPAAESSFRAALRLEPELVAARRSLGLLLVERGGQAAEAREHLQAVLVQTPEDSVAAAALSRLRGRSSSRGEDAR